MEKARFFRAFACLSNAHFDRCMCKGVFLSMACQCSFDVNVQKSDSSQTGNVRTTAQVVKLFLKRRTLVHCAVTFQHLDVGQSTILLILMNSEFRNVVWAT